MKNSSKQRLPLLFGFRRGSIQELPERHRFLKYVAHSLYILPGLKSILRIAISFVIQHSFLSLKDKQRLYNFFAADISPTIPVICSAQIVRGQSVKLNLDLQDGISRMWYYWGYNGYERSTTKLFLKLLESRSCVFDVGANIGYYTILAASLLDSHGEVHGFEPVPHVFYRLLNNAQLNRLKCLHLNSIALSDKDGQEPLFLPSNLAWSNASLIEGFTDQKDCISAETMRFDTYCLKNAIRVVDLIKIDVEGAELKVFHGMGALLDMWLPDIICEVLEPFEKDLDAFFLRKAYRKFLITDKGLEEVDRLRAHAQYRDYYLSCAPISIASG